MHITLFKVRAPLAFLAQLLAAIFAHQQAYTFFPLDKEDGMTVFLSSFQGIGALVPVAKHSIQLGRNCTGIWKLLEGHIKYFIATISLTIGGGGEG